MPRRPQVISHWTAVGSRSMHSRTAAVAPPPGSPVVVLVHGLGVSSRYMVPTVRALSRDCLTYAVDLPGYGRTPGPRDALSIPQLADALVAWMDAMNIVQPLLLGNSMGCQILAEMALRYPARVERLVLVGPTIDRRARTGVQQFWRLLVDTFREAPSQPFVVAYDYVVFGLRRFRQTFSDALADRIEDKLPHLRIPVMVVRGSRDPIAPRAWSREMADLAPLGTYAEVAGAGHTVNYMRPAVLAALVRRFLAEPPYAGQRSMLTSGS